MKRNRRIFKDSFRDVYMVAHRSEKQIVDFALLKNKEKDIKRAPPSTRLREIIGREKILIVHQRLVTAKINNPSLNIAYTFHFLST